MNGQAYRQIGQGRKARLNGGKIIKLIFVMATTMMTTTMMTTTMMATTVMATTMMATTVMSSVMLSAYRKGKKYTINYQYEF